MGRVLRGRNMGVSLAVLPLQVIVIVVVVTYVCAVIRRLSGFSVLGSLFSVVWMYSPANQQSEPESESDSPAASYYCQCQDSSPSSHST